MSDETQMDRYKHRCQRWWRGQNYRWWREMGDELPMDHYKQRYQRWWWDLFANELRILGPGSPFFSAVFASLLDWCKNGRKVKKRENGGTKKIRNLKKKPTKKLKESAKNRKEAN